MAGQKITSEGTIKGLFLALLIMFVLTSIINISAINSDDPNTAIFREDVNYGSLTNKVFGFIIAFLAVFLAWRFTGNYQLGLKYSRKQFFSLLIFGAVLYILWTIVGQQIGLQPLEFSGAQVQSIIKP